MPSVSCFRPKTKFPGTRDVPQNKCKLLNSITCHHPHLVTCPTPLADLIWPTLIYLTFAAKLDYFFARIFHLHCGLFHWPSCWPSQGEGNHTPNPVLCLPGFVACPWLLRLGQRLCPIVLCFLLCSQFSLFRWLIKLQVRVFSSRHFLTLSASVTCISVSLYRCIWPSIPMGFIDCTRFGKCPALCKPSGYISCARCCALSYTLKTYQISR